MSGIEIAGLVLGGFPLLISAAEHYKEGFEPILKWKRFRSDFIGFIDAVDIEKQLFDQMLERFLISLDIQQDELQYFLTDPTYEGWQRKDIIERINSRLGPSYKAYISTIGTMNKLMLDMQALLSLKDGQIEWANEGASRWDYQLKRIHLSFSKKGKTTLSSLELHNRKLRELLASSNELDTLKATRKDTKWAKVFNCIRQHASSIHMALTSGWTCDCAAHIASLQLEKRKTGDWSSNFTISFSISKSHQNRVGNIRREVNIKTRKGSCAEGVSPMNSNNSLDQILVKEHYLNNNISNLRRDFEIKSSYQVNDMPHLTLPSPTPVSSSSSQYTSSKYFSSRSSAGTTSLATTECLEDGKLRWLSGPRRKPKKNVRIELPDELPIRSQSIPTTSLIPETPPQALQTIKAIEIKDLCSTMGSTSLDCECLGYLSDGQISHEIYPVLGAETSPEDSYISLETVLSKQSSIRLTQQNRYKLAGIIASSLLQLQTTPWLLEEMEKKNILFYRKGKQIRFEQPYIKHTFGYTKGSSNPSSCVTETLPSTTRLAARNSLSSLGILLLELCFGQAIEDQETRKNYLGLDGKPHRGTDYMTARDWLEAVWEEDPALEPIIRCCINCTFEEKADWTNSRFTQAVYVGVVEPLDRIITERSMT